MGVPASFAEGSTNEETRPCKNVHYAAARIQRTFQVMDARAYFRCQACALIFADRTSLLSAEDEKARYKLHQNNPQDTGYRAFLARLVDPLAERLGVSPLEGLDFGCGPGPTLSGDDGGNGLLHGKI